MIRQPHQGSRKYNEEMFNAFFKISEAMPKAFQGGFRRRVHEPFSPGYLKNFAMEESWPGRLVAVVFLIALGQGILLETEEDFWIFITEKRITKSSFNMERLATK